MKTLLNLIVVSALVAHFLIGYYMFQRWIGTIRVWDVMCAYEIEEALRAMRYHGEKFTICEGGVWKVRVRDRYWIDSITVYKRLSQSRELKS